MVVFWKPKVEKNSRREYSTEPNNNWKLIKDRKMTIGFDN